MFKSRDKALLNLPLSLQIFKAASFFPIQTRMGSKIMTKEGRTEEGSPSSSRLDRGPSAKDLVPSVQESKGQERLSDTLSPTPGKKGQLNAWLLFIFLSRHHPSPADTELCQAELLNPSPPPHTQLSFTKCYLTQMSSCFLSPNTPNLKKLLCLLDHFVVICRTF